MIRESADRITESAKLGTKVCVCVCVCSKSTTVLSESMVPKSIEVNHIFIVLEISSIGPYVYSSTVIHYIE
jgi:hypothetical protein